MPGDFGALTDHFGILAIVDGGGTLGDILTLVDSSKVPHAQSRADATDEAGDIAAASWYGNTAGALFDASCTYALKSGSLATELLSLGELSVGVFAATGEIGTGNDGWPQLVVSGVLGAEAITVKTGFQNLFFFPAMSPQIAGIKCAQPLGFTVTAGCKLTGSSISATIELAQQENGLGEPVAHGMSGGVMVGTGEFVRITAAPAWTVTQTDAEETQAPGEEEGQAAYHTGSGTYELILAREATP